jgi:hypothetical protein
VSRAKNIKVDGSGLESSLKSSSSARLLDLQWLQLKHDERFHKEIYALSVADRLKHFALHMAKYVGYVATSIDSEDRTLFERALVDTFIISLACANTLMIDLEKVLDCGEGVAADELREFGRELLGRIPGNGADSTVFLKLMAHYTGRLAKACESLDHIESYPFREAISAAVLDLFRLVLAEGAAMNFDLVDKAAMRLKEVESKDIFYRYL